MSAFERGQTSSPHTAQTIQAEVLDAIRNTTLANYSLRSRDAVIPLGDVLGHTQLLAGSLHIETERFAIDLFVERWENYSLNTRYTAGVDPALYTGCVEVRDLHSGQGYRGQMRERTAAGEIRYKPSGPLEYDTILDEVRSVLGRQRGVLEEAMHYELAALAKGALEALDWTQGAVSFGGASYEARYADWQLSVSRKHFLWHAITATRSQGVLANLQASIHGAVARDLYKTCSRCDTLK